MRRPGSPGPSNPAGQTILLISDDEDLLANLRSLANTLGHIVVKAGITAGTVPILRATKPGVVLLDLDLPQEAAWETAELLLQQLSCPPVILLTARTEPFDVRTALRAGSLMNKSQSPSRLLAAVEELLGLPRSTQAERNAVQRILVSWLNPSR